MNDQKGANILRRRCSRPRVELIADRGYDSNAFRAALAERGIAACIPLEEAAARSPIPYDKARLPPALPASRSLFGRLKDWRRIATRYDRCAHNLLRPPSPSPPSSSSGSTNES
jgi:transposase